MKMMDERIKQAYNRIMSEFGIGVFFFALAAFLVKIIWFHKGIQDCAVEYVIIIGAPVFQAVRSRQLKVAFYQKGMEKNYWKKSLAVLAAIVLLYLAVSWKIFGNPAARLLPLAVFAAVFAALRVILIGLEKRRAGKLEQEFEDE